jgi:polysaccharide biosynthesis/export protein
MNYRFTLLGFLLLLSVTACVPYRDMVLFRKAEAPLPDMEATNAPLNAAFQIQPNDALSIKISCIDPQLAIPFNLVESGSVGTQQSDSPLVSFLVDSNGDIEYPVIGKIHAAKLTVPQLRDTLYKKIKPYIKDPSISIRRVNFRITVLGEVVKPGSFTMLSERITILEALGMAGDMTPYSDRQRVLVVRETNGKTTFGKLDLQSPDFFKSPYYYLQQNDVVYIDPKKTKKGGVNDQASKYVNWTTAALSAVATTLTVLFLLKK